MRTSLCFVAVALVAFMCIVGSSSANDVCNSILNCGDCVSNTSNSCGWCSDWNGCMSGSGSGPFWGSCSGWHKDSCVGVSVPRVASCNGSPMSAMRVRQLMGGGGAFANITASAKWTQQSRTCNPVTGCTNWVDKTSVPPTTEITLQVESNTVHLNVITGTCRSTCYDSNYQIPFYGGKYYGLDTASVGQTTLSFNRQYLPTMYCSSTSCNGRAFTGSSGATNFVFSGELTDNCLHIWSKYDSSSLDFLELYLIF